MIRIVIADDQALIRDGLKMVLESDPDIKVVGMAADGNEAVATTLELKPDLVLMDVRMPVKDGFWATKEIKAVHPGIYVLILTNFNEQNNLLQSLSSQCDGFLLKGMNMIELIATIKNTVSGLKTMDGDAYQTLLQYIQQQPGLPMQEPHAALDPEEVSLTPTESKIVRLVTYGKKNSEIAKELFLTEGHVRNTISRILGKLDMRNSRELAVWGARHFM